MTPDRLNRILSERRARPRPAPVPSGDIVGPLLDGDAESARKSALANEAVRAAMPRDLVDSVTAWLEPSGRLLVECDGASVFERVFRAKNAVECAARARLSFGRIWIARKGNTE